MAKRVLVLWADDESSNLGVRVLGRGAMSLACKAWGSDTEVEFQSFGVGPLGTQLSGKVVLSGLLTGSRKLQKQMIRYDAVIDTGAGDSFTDIYGLKRLAIMLYARHVAKLAGVPVILAPQTIGPFGSRWGRLAARRTLKHSNTIMARDSTSMDYAQGLGFRPDCLATDVVFALDQPRTATPETADVALNVSGLLWNTDTHVSRTTYQTQMRDLVEKILAEKRSITLMAHVVENPSPDNDMTAVHALASEFGDRVGVFVPDGLDDARAFISGCNVVIGARMHACLNALSLGVPAIPLAYSRKFAPLLADIGWPYTIDLRHDIEVPEKVMELLERSDLREQAVRVRARAELRLDEAVTHLANKSGV